MTALITDEERAVVAQPVGRLHVSPSVDAEIATDTIYGAVLTVHSRTHDWTRVAAEDGTQGWLRNSDMLAVSTLRPEHKYAVVVVDRFAHVFRDQEARSGPPLLTLPFEAILRSETLPERANPWHPVTLLDGRTGWIRSRSACVWRRLTAGQLTDLARQCVGIPWMWGGCSSFGYNCSGLAQMLCRQRGFLIPRLIGAQVEWLARHARVVASPRAGDVLLFGVPGFEVRHVGIALSRDKFVHATIHGRPFVQISSLSRYPWCERFMSCWRLPARLATHDPTRTALLAVPSHAGYGD